MTFFVVPAENFQEQRYIWKDSPDFPDWISQQKFVFHFFKAMFDTSFRPFRPFSGKWNWFVQMVNTIPEWHSRGSVTLVITGTLSFRACEAHTYLATFFVSVLLASYKSTYTLCLSPAWWSAFQDLFYCHRDSSSADGIGLVCSAVGTCALLTPISVKGTIVRAKAKALLKTRTQKWLIVNATSHSCVSYLISLYVSYRKRKLW